MAETQRANPLNTPMTASYNDPVVAVDELGREIRVTRTGQRYLATDLAPARPQATSGRGLGYNILDNIIGYDDGVDTPGERAGAAIGAIASDPIGAARGAVTGVGGIIERLVGGTGTMGDVIDATGLLNLGSVAGAAPRGALRAGAGRDAPDTSYRMSHQPVGPGSEDAVRLDDLTRSITGEAAGYPEDFYGPQGPQYYAPPPSFAGDEYGVANQQSYRAIQAVRNNPDAEITIYRAVPNDENITEINPGDWITLSPKYAELHAASGYGPRGEDAGKVISQTVRVRDIFFGGDDVNEFGFFPSERPQTPAQRVAGLLSSGRADEVTDEMMAAADPQEMARLYVSGATGMDLPMDFESRMARAREMGFTDDAYHATGADFQQFIPSEFRGASFFGSTAEGASKGASASANEGFGSGSGIMMPVRVNTSGVEGLGRYARRDMNEFRASLPDRIYTEAEVDALMTSDAAPLRGNWDDFFTDLTDYDALRAFREQNPDAPIPEGIIAFRPKQPLSYGPHLNSTQALNLSGRQFPHYSEGMSERPTSEYVKSQGNTGFTMLDESGLALAMVDPTRIRSRFARFDPRLSHLSNLNAANASPLLGGAVLAAPQEQPDPLRNLRGLLAR